MTGNQLENGTHHPTDGDKLTTGNLVVNGEITMLLHHAVLDNTTIWQLTCVSEKVTGNLAVNGEIMMLPEVVPGKIPLVVLVLQLHANSHSMPTAKDHSMSAPRLMLKVTLNGPHHGAQLEPTQMETTFQETETGLSADRR